MVSLLPKLGIDAIIELSYYLSFEAKMNDKVVWRAVEEASLANIHLLDLKQSCQLQWGTMQLKPCMTSVRFRNMLFAQAREKAEQGLNSPEEFHWIMQGHRIKNSKDLYLKMKKNLMDRKDVLFQKPKADASTEDKKKWADEIVNTLFSFASNRPKRYGVYKVHARDEIDELLAHYEHDLCEAAPLLDADGVTRLAQIMYLLKSKAYENIWWRIENRVHELAEIDGALDIYNITNIIRSFSRSQENQMSGSDKLFYHLEPSIIKNID